MDFLAFKWTCFLLYLLIIISLVTHKVTCVPVFMTNKDSVNLHIVIGCV